MVGDDEYDIYKAQAGRNMRDRLGLGLNPLDGATFHVRKFLDSGVFTHPDTQTKKSAYMFQYFPQGGVDTVPDTRRQSDQHSPI